MLAGMYVFVSNSPTGDLQFAEAEGRDRWYSTLFPSRCSRFRMGQSGWVAMRELQVLRYAQDDKCVAVMRTAATAYLSTSPIALRAMAPVEMTNGVESGCIPYRDLGE
jgi:hypothetical protein